MARPRTTHAHLPKYVTISNGSYYYGPTGQPRKRLCRVEDPATMYRMVADLMAGMPAGPQETIGDSLDRYEREIVPTLAPRTQKDYHKHIAVLRAWVGKLRPDELRPRDIGKFLDVDKGKIQRNKCVSVLSAVYTKMVGRWYVAERNPCIGVERNKSRKRTRYVTDAEYAALYALMPPRLQVAMELALLTGQRQGDLLSLQWAQVDAKETVVRFQQGKTGKKIAIRISPRLEKALLRAKTFLPHLPRRYVLRNADGEPYTSEGFRAMWQRYMNRAARGYGIQKAKGHPVVRHPPVLKERFTFHDLRAKNISDTKDITDAMHRAGHQSMTMTRSVYDRAERVVDALE